MIFERMESEYGITPNVVHYNTMVSLIGRFATAKEAYCFITERMVTVKHNKVVWMTLVACCGMEGDFELGEYICKEKLPGGEGDKQLHNMYASAQRYDKAAEVRKRIEQSRNKKLRRAAFSKLVD
ncbi:hypothetical protein MtrunA17_Chr3g0098651 [Medicago truncatula]|uniref:Editing factor, putative n=1 Tax=Medicago truncatula TaxID=3880 RepID=G7IXJ8_MEDTR|nr:editing factor, putative [Medicago truncatula]RHN67065.1 hypothetical protein MtrunA17_Chr3g0098651 [Medicago truncatula]